MMSSNSTGSRRPKPEASRAARKPRRTVISIAGIRTVAPPEQHQPAPAEGLSVGTFSTGDLPFQLDEQDPILEGNAAGTATTNNPTATTPAVIDKAPPTKLEASSNATEESSIQVRDQGDDNHANMRQEAADKGIETQEDLTGDHDNRDKEPDSEPDLESTSDSSDDEYFETHQNTGKTLRDEETMLLDRIDADIIRAEEEDLMDKVDRDILRAEENNLLDRALYNIEQAEVLERLRSKPSLVTDVIDCDDPDSVFTDSWQLPPPVKRRRRLRTRKKPVFRDVTSLDFCHAKHIIPKYLDRGRLLFTRAQFQTCVIDVIEEGLRIKDSAHQWQVDVQEEHPNNPNSYSLTYRGPLQHLETLANRAEAWIEYRVACSNQSALLEDGESILVDVPVDGTKSLGATVSKPFEKLGLTTKHRLPLDEGVWVYINKPETQLAQTIGMSAFDSGCAILAIDSQACTSYKELLVLLNRNKSENRIVVTLCLSKHADLSMIDAVAMNLRRLDGEPYAAADYEEHRLERMAQQEDLLAVPTLTEVNHSWVEYPPEGAPAPTALPSRRPKTSEERLNAIASVLGDDRRVEVDLFISSHKTLQAKTESDEWRRGGIWVHDFQVGGQMYNILGEKACSLGAVMMKANGVVLHTVETLREIRANARTYGDDDTFRVTFVFYDGTDLSGIDTTKLIQGRVNPRRNGQPYPLHLYSNKIRKKDAALKKKRCRSRSKPETVEEEPVVKKKRDRPPKNSSQGPLSKKGRVDDTRSTSRKVDIPPPYKPRISAVDSYKSFTEKVRPIVDIDYKSAGARSGAHMTAKVISSMWSQHKFLLGNDVMCDDNCTCLRRLPKLVKNVTKEYVADQKKNGYSVDESSLKSAGFALYFAPKFLPLLAKERPNETTSQQIRRLVDMWPLHQKQRRYGGRCNQDCDCLEAWQLVFGKGDRENAEIRSKSQKRNATTNIPPKRAHVSESSTVQSEQPRNSIATIPRIPKANRPGKRSSLVASNETGSKRSAPGAIPRNQKLPQPEMQSSILASYEVGHHRPTGSTNAVPRKQKTMAKEKQLSSVTNYEIWFDAFAPLGAYFVADMGQWGSRCKIHSIFEKGQAKQHQRIRPGTIVDCVIVSMEKHKINNPSELKHFYDSARKAKSKLHLSLENSQVGNSNMYLGTIGKDWSQSGNWRGTLNHGWPGGASILEAKTKESQMVTTRPGLNVPAPDVPKRRSSHSLLAPSEAHHGVVVEWKEVSSSAVPEHRTSRPSKSVLRGVGHSRQNDKSVNFVKEFETREFEKEENAADWLVKILRPATAESAYSVPTQSPEEAFVSAVRQRACKDLVQVLEQGAASDQRVVESMQEEYAQLKNTMGSVERGLTGRPSDSLLLQRLRDLNAKKIVLKAYIQTAYWIERVMELQHWTGFEIRVRCIELRKTSSIDVQGRTDAIVGKVRTEFLGVSDHLGELPPRRPTEYIMYTDTDGDHVPVFKAFNNFRLSQKQLNLVIEMEEGVREDSVPPTKLGAFSITLNRIDQQCPNDYGSPITIKQLASTNERLIKSEVEIEVRRFKVDSKFIQAKKQEVEGKMAEQILNITRFNENEGVSASCKLTGNISGRGGLTLLHAAIQLQMEASVKKLLELGANPLQRSVNGTPLSMAVKMKDRVWEKLMKNKEERRDELVITKTEELHEMYQRVVDLLRGRKEDTIQNSPEGTVLQRSSLVQASLVQQAGLYSDLPRDLPSSAASCSVAPDQPPPGDNIVLQEILRLGPTPPGYSEGTAVKKSIVGCRLKEIHPDYFPDKASVKSFFERVVAQGIAVELGTAGNVVLKAGSASYYDNLRTNDMENMRSDRDILVGIFQSAPSPAGYKPGIAATKSIVGSRLREKYARHFHEKSHVKDFLERVIAQGIVTEVGSGTTNVVLKLTNTTNLIPNSQDARPLPGDLDLLREMLRTAHPTPGYRPGTAVRRSIVSSWLRQHHPRYFYDKQTVKAFFDRVVSRGIAVEIAIGTERILQSSVALGP